MDKQFKKVCNIAPNGNSFTALSGGYLTVTFAYHYILLMLLACSVKRISFIMQMWMHISFLSSMPLSHLYVKMVVWLNFLPTKCFPFPVSIDLILCGSSLCQGLVVHKLGF